MLEFEVKSKVQPVGEQGADSVLCIVPADL